MESQIKKKGKISPQIKDESCSDILTPTLAVNKACDDYNHNRLIKE